MGVRRRTMVAGVVSLGALAALAQEVEPVPFFDPEFLLQGAFFLAPYDTRSAVADFDGDGHWDLAFQANSAVIVLFGDGAGGVREQLTTEVFGSFLGYRDGMTSVAGDIDGDGDVDLLAIVTGYSANSATLWVLRNDGSGGFAVNPVELPGTTTAALAMGTVGPGPALGVVVGTSSQGAWLLRPDGQGGLELDRQIVTDAPLYAAHFVDLDGDGRRDLVLGTSTGVRIARSTATGLEAPGPINPVGFWAGPVAADFDGDGAEEILTTSGTFGTDGAGGLLKERDSAAAFAFAYHVSDVDHDGDPDLLTMQKTPAESLLIHRNDGSGSLGGPETHALPFVGGAGGATYYSISNADFDEDGLDDLAITASRDGVLLLRRAGSGPPGNVHVEPEVIDGAGPIRLDVSGVRFLEGVEVEVEGGNDPATAFASDVRLDADVTFPAGEGGGPRTVTVRNPDGQVGLGQVVLHSLTVRQSKGKLKNVIEPARDVLVLRGTIRHNTLSSAGGTPGLVERGFVLSLGDPAAPLVFVASPDDPRWRAPRKPDKGRFVWETRFDEFPRAKLVIDPRRHTFNLRVSYYDHPAVDSSIMEMLWTSGDDLGVNGRTWSPNPEGTRYRLKR